MLVKVNFVKTIAVFIFYSETAPDVRLKGRLLCFYSETPGRCFFIWFSGWFDSNGIRPWTLSCELLLCSSSASSAPLSARPSPTGSTLPPTTRWPVLPASWPTSVTGPPWPPSPRTSRWSDSRSPTSSRSATVRWAPAAASPTCT